MRKQLNKVMAVSILAGMLGSLGMTPYNTVYAAVNTVPIEKNLSELIPVTLVLNDGTGRTLSGDTTMGCAADTPVDYEMKRTGYIFTGWYTEEGGLYNYEKVTKPMSLYAGWKESLATITFHWNDGTNRVYAEQELESVSGPIRYNLSGQREGYTFNGWMTADGRKIDPDLFAVAQDTDLYAIWN